MFKLRNGMYEKTDVGKIHEWEPCKYESLYYGKDIYIRSWI